MEKAYSWIYDFFGGNEFLLNVVAGVGIVNIFFYLFNSAFVLIDTLEPSWSMRFKVQQSKKPTLSKYSEALKLVLFNQFVTGVIVTALFHYPMKFTGVSFDKKLPPVTTVLAQIVVCIFVEEIGFYYSHRLFHHPKIYKHIHKVHHEWTAPVSITSIYCHPIEHAFSNLLPVLLGPTLCGSHITTLWIWACIAIMSTTFSHSGYHFPFQPSPEAHDYHHKVFNECFGVLGILDYLHGTANTFRRSVHFKRHITYFSWTPIKEIFPDK
ncbi:Dietary restriction down regulated [Trichostrongylus colubriformis]|uniref:Dietary restriction down regulated n=1 Tax=Trichostrongylus colubriformis TaxID=6319 RepID=A0AAN8IF44_TRICO